MKIAHDIIIRPVLTEKSYDHIPQKEIYLCRGQERSQDRDQGGAVEEIFGVKVDERQHRQATQGKMKRQGLHRGPHARGHQEGFRDA